MTQKVDRISQGLSQKLQDWRQVDSILLAESAQSAILDPYFFISLDIYYRGILPNVDQRQRLFSDAGAFESSSVSSKDRFLLEDIPVRVEYKDMNRVDEILARTRENMWVFRQTGTYMFYRLVTGKIMIKKTDWLDTARALLNDMPDSFWSLLITSSRATMEHYLSDLISAVMRDDQLFYLISAAGFIKSFLSLLFVINHCFEPSGRKLYEMVWKLPELPENFKGRFESFLREDAQFPPSRKMEIAELLARSVVRMC